MFINVGTCGFDLNQRSGSELTGAIAEAKAKAYPLLRKSGRGQAAIDLR
jgi:hypothetical protein